MMRYGRAWWLLAAALLLLSATSGWASALGTWGTPFTTDAYGNEIYRGTMIGNPAGGPGDDGGIGSGSQSSADVWVGGAATDPVPTSSWTYGCSATSAGMMFGYYDRLLYTNMYAGPANGGLAPLADLGNQCSIIATMNGFDGRATFGHVDDYWTGYGNGGPDPWVGNWAEHAWDACTADFMGTNQWKWDYSPWPAGDGVIDSNVDGGTSLFWYTTPALRLYDYMPPAANGLPRTEMTHGLRLFAEDRGYTLQDTVDPWGNPTKDVYTQMTDNMGTGGFSFSNYMWEIDNGYPVLIQVVGHTMVGVGYSADAKTVLLHDTWGDYVGSMAWGGYYSGMEMEAVTVMHMNPAPEPATLVLLLSAAVPFGIRKLRKR